MIPVVPGHPVCLISNKTDNIAYTFAFVLVANYLSASEVPWVPLSEWWATSSTDHCSVLASQLLPPPPPERLLLFFDVFVIEVIQPLNSLRFCSRRCHSLPTNGGWKRRRGKRADNYGWQRWRLPLPAWTPTSKVKMAKKLLANVAVTRSLRQLKRSFKLLCVIRLRGTGGRSFVFVWVVVFNYFFVVAVKMVCLLRQNGYGSFVCSRKQGDFTAGIWLVFQIGSMRERGTIIELWYEY